MVVIDSDVLIRYLRGNAAARNWLVEARKTEKLVISVVTAT
jgi:predicted nucleic acid-binding protein